MTLHPTFYFLFLLILCLTSGCKDLSFIPEPQPGDTVFAFIGDFGHSGLPAEKVAHMVVRWDPDFIVTAGDNNYNGGKLEKMKDNITRYYGHYIYNPDAPAGYSATGRAQRDEENRFFPAPGNHDYDSDIDANYLSFFTLPGNERWYDFRKGSVHFFSLDSNVESDFPEMREWLETKVAASDAPFKVVIFHHPPFSASKHGNFVPMQWNFTELGICAVLTGHDHTYQHIIEKAQPSVHYIVNGSGGRIGLTGCSKNPLDESLFATYCYNKKHGAVRAVSNEETLTFEFYSVEAGGRFIDEVVIEKPE